MDILYILIPVSLVLVVLIAAVFFWSVRTGQYEDLEGPAYRILMDDDNTHQSSSQNQKDDDQHRHID